MDCKIKPVSPKGNQPSIFFGRTDAEAEVPVLVQRADSLEKILLLGKIEGKRRSGWQRVRCLDCITNSMDMSLNKLQGTVKDQKAWHSAVSRVTKTRT